MYTDLEIARKMLNKANDAKQRNIDFSLSFSTFKRLMYTKKCFFSGVNFENVENHPLSRSIDRLDNSKGYVEGNVVACTVRMNSMKNSLSIEQINFLYKGLKKKGLIK